MAPIIADRRVSKGSDSLRSIGYGKYSLAMTW